MNEKIKTNGYKIFLKSFKERTKPAEYRIIKFLPGDLKNNLPAGNELVNKIKELNLI